MLANPGARKERVAQGVNLAQARVAVVSPVGLPRAPHLRVGAQAARLREAREHVQGERHGARAEIAQARRPEEIQDEEDSTGREGVAQAREERGGVEVVERRDRRDAVERLARQLEGRRVRHPELEVREGGRALAGEADHVRREIEGEHGAAARREQPAQLAGAAADLEGALAALPELSQQHRVVVAVVVPAVLGEERDAVEVALHLRRHRATSRRTGSQRYSTSGSFSGGELTPNFTARKPYFS